MAEDTQTIIVGKDKHEIEVKPITMIFVSPNIAMGPDIEYPGRIVLTMRDTLLQADRLSDKGVHREFEKYWRIFMENTSGCHPKPPLDYEIKPSVIRTMGTGAKHLMGLIDLALKMQDLKVGVVFRHPESSLHPGWQVALGDLFIHLARRGEEGSGGKAVAVEETPK